MKRAYTLKSLVATGDGEDDGESPPDMSFKPTKRMASSPSLRRGGTAGGSSGFVTVGYNFVNAKKQLTKAKSLSSKRRQRRKNFIDARSATTGLLLGGTMREFNNLGEDEEDCSTIAEGEEDMTSMEHIDSTNTTISANPAAPSTPNSDKDWNCAHYHHEEVEEHVVNMVTEVA